MEELKTCSKCGDDKPLSAFHKDKNNPSGHKAYCKECFKSNYQDKAMQKVYYNRWYAKVCDERIKILLAEKVAH